MLIEVTWTGAVVVQRGWYIEASVGSLVVKGSEGIGPEMEAESLFTNKDHLNIILIAKGLFNQI
jgi:hypothetical protein